MPLRQVQSEYITSLKSTGSWATWGHWDAGSLLTGKSELTQKLTMGMGVLASSLGPQGLALSVVIHSS